MWVPIVALIACGGSSADVAPDAMGRLGDGGIVASECPPGEFASALSEGGVLLCNPIDDAARAAIAGSCDLYLGWQDSCDGCSTIPEKWGRVSLDSCEDGAGTDNSCADTDLGGLTLPLFGVDLDGEANGDDKFHAAFDCAPPDDAPVADPCPPGSFLAAVGDSGTTECVTGHGAIAGYLEQSCEIFFGWRDNCDGCTGAPDKWGRAGSLECTVEVGADSTCDSFRLGAEPVFTLGINTDGDVDGNDKFFLGFRCEGAEAAESLQPFSCPPGQLVVGIDSRGVQCASPALETEAFVQEGCFLYLGWRDSCSGCADPPTKWGRVGHTSCQNGAGSDNTCAATPLDGTSVELFGLNTDNDVDGNDKFYVGMACPDEL